MADSMDFFRTGTDYSKVPTCPDHPGAGEYFVPTPEKVHYGKMVCSECGRFLRWVSKPSDEKRARHGTGKLVKQLQKSGIDYCQMCLRHRDELPPSVTFVAHHVIEVQDGGTNDPANLWHVCTICHELIHLLRRNRIDPKDRPIYQNGKERAIA